jgi:hypothetical protein
MKKFKQDKPLTCKEIRFCIILANQEKQNASKAYLEAGYEVKNINVARVGASKLLRKGNLQRFLANYSESQVLEAQITPSHLMAELKKVAFDATGEEIPSKVRAIEILMKRLHMLDETKNVNQNINVTTKLTIEEQDRLTKIVDAFLEDEKRLLEISYGAGQITGK